MAESSLYNKILKQEEDFLVSLARNSYLQSNNIYSYPNCIVDTFTTYSVQNPTYFAIDGNNNLDYFIQAQVGSGTQLGLRSGSYLRGNFKFEEYPPLNSARIQPISVSNDAPIIANALIDNGGIGLDNTIFKYGSYSLILDGVDDQLVFTNPVNLLNYNFTMSVWVRMPDAIPVNGYPIIYSGNGSPSSSFDWWITQNGMKFVYTNDGTSEVELESDIFSWSTDTWYYITVERDGNNLNFYLDGVKVGTSVIGGTIFETTGSAGIGTNTTGIPSQYFKGWMDDFTIRYKAIYNGVNFTPPIGELISQELENLVEAESITIDLPVDITRLKVILIGVNIKNDFTIDISLDNGSTYTSVPLFFRSSATSNQDQTTKQEIMIGSIDATSLTNTNQLKYKISTTNNLDFTLNNIIISWDTKISEQESITEPTASGGATAQDVWEYSDRTLTSASGISMDDVIATQADLPVGNLTVRQAFELLIKRLKRDKNSPKI